MASTLSHAAIHRISSLVLCAPIGKNEDKNANYGVPYVLKRVNRKWKTIYKLYRDFKSAPPLDYLDSLELALILKGEVDDEDVRTIFAHGKPLKFCGCPRLLVSKIVEAFTVLQQEPECLDVTIKGLPDFGVTRPSEAWPQVYRTHLPCHACTTVESVDKRRHPIHSSHSISSSVAPATAFTVEKFHVSSKSFRKRLTLEVHYRLVPTIGTEREQSSVFRKMTIRLTDKTCSAQGRLSGTASRSRATLLLLPDLASDVFGFLERAHIGSSLLANRDLHDHICQHKQHLPVHKLTCFFGSERLHSGAAHRLAVRHFQRDLSYTDVRRFKIPSAAGAEHDCALMRHYLNNSYVDDLQAPQADFRFTIKLLASLAARNFSVGSVELYASAKRLTDYRSMDAVFGGLRMSELYLGCDDRRFVELVKTTDFFRMSTLQGLRVLNLTLCGEAWNDEQKPTRRAESKSPLWVSGIYQLHNCQHYRVDYYWTGRVLRSIERKIVQICEEFERGKITDTVNHFQFRPSSWRRMNYAFRRDNLLVSGMKVEGKKQWHRTNDFAWDVYRFRNASTGGYLTACVGRNTSAHGTESILHIVKGEAYPDVSFVGY